MYQPTAMNTKTRSQSRLKKKRKIANTLARSIGLNGVVILCVCVRTKNKQSVFIAVKISILKVTTLSASNS